ncbi:hypothetical protein MAPG_08165 [Magnaporthiopsis poae ATCC 64411]|uniref:Uncharacterized protein n=1 Tax=Magnaporthiopsis poae (strain ATCC 64411 / 73-15) TaxID=644358 RepID=A0A0C4E6M2_MAGP6|nr:hypothetical protein MAPG_08165 [Magnaporthiopsis poae ATCC 64411]
MHIPYPPSRRGAAEPISIAIETPAWLRGALSSVANIIWASSSSPSSPFSSPGSPTLPTPSQLLPPQSQTLRRRQDPGPLSVNAMVGIVVGILLVAFIALVFWFLYYFRPLGRRRKHHHRRRHRKSTGSSSDAAPAAPADPPPAA